MFNDILPEASENLIQFKNPDCQFSTYVFTLKRCVYQQNFLNCPPALFNEGEYCKEVKKFVQTNDKCGQIYGTTFLVDESFWY